MSHYAASGPVNVSGGGGAVNLRPAGLVLRDLAAGNAASLAGGSIAATATDLQISNLHAGVAGGQAEVSGRYTFADGSAALTALWQDITLAKNVKGNGDLSLKMTQPWKGQPSIDLALNANGAAATETAKPDMWDAHFAPARRRAVVGPTELEPVTRRRRPGHPHRPLRPAGRHRRPPDPRP